MKEQLVALAKSRGFEIAEDAAEQLSGLAFDVVSLAVSLSSNPYDDMVWAAVKGKAEEEVAKLVDKIDGKEG